MPTPNPKDAFAQKVVTAAPTTRPSAQTIYFLSENAKNVVFEVDPRVMVYVVNESGLILSSY